MSGRRSRGRSRWLFAFLRCEFGSSSVGFGVLGCESGVRVSKLEEEALAVQHHAGEGKSPELIIRVDAPFSVDA